jgi:TPR repeat protein
VRRDDLKAYQHFSAIADRHADVSPDSPHARVVAQAFVALGGYHLSGIPNTRVKRDPTRATEMFHYAASYFNDADAQFYLGRIFSEGVSGPKDLHQAARWFNLAAEKGHVPAQARLGQMLFNGDGVPRQAPRGLMWMQVAATKADPARDAWVLDLNARARDIATEDERRLADAYLRKYQRAMR